MSIEGQGHFFTICFPGFVCFVLYKATISGERLQDHWSSGLKASLRDLPYLILMINEVFGLTMLFSFYMYSFL